MVEIDPNQIANTFIALLPVETVVIGLVLTLNKKVRAMWGLLAPFLRLSKDDLKFLEWWAVDSMAKEKQHKLEMLRMDPDWDGRVPWA